VARRAARVLVPVPSGPAGREAAIHAERMLVVVLLLVRGGRLLQGVITIGFGFAAWHRPWAAGLALLATTAWSALLARNAWRLGCVTPRLAAADVAVALFALALTAISTPPHLIATSFYWVLLYAQSSALVAAVAGARRQWTTAVAPLVLMVVYGLIVDLEAGRHALLEVSGNAIGIALFYAVGAVAGTVARQQGRGLDRTEAAIQVLEEQLAVRRTRFREFRRLHDDAVQVLERAAAVDQPQSPELRHHARRAAADLRQAMAGRRTETVSLAAALTELADLFRQRGLAVEVEQLGALRPLDGACSELLRGAVAEALTNARKHAGTHRAAVRVQTTEAGVAASVEDWGHGFDPATVGAGFGMENSIRGRLEEAGGSVTVESGPGAGTLVTMWLPC
jgi:signal transduction histidine kinase